MLGTFVASLLESVLVGKKAIQAVEGIIRTV